MKKIAKQPRKFGRRKAKHKSAKKAKHIERAIKSIADETIVLLDEISPGFAAWYHENYR